jgi:hypothetical protein
VASNDAVRASSRPKNSSTTRRATWVDRVRSVGAWKEPTLSAREWRRAALEALGANGSCACTKSSAAAVNASSMVRATSTGSDRAPRRADPTGSTSPTPSRRGGSPGAGSSESPFATPVRMARRDSRTSAEDLEGATISTRCPRSASRADSRSTYVLTSCPPSKA